MNHPQHSFARLSLGAFAKGGSGVPPFSAPATIIHHQHQMYGSSRGGEPRGACSIHAPVVDHKSQQGRVHSVPVCMSAFGFSSPVGAVSLPLTGRGFGSGLFSQFGSRLEQRYGLSPNQIMHLRSKRAKSCDVSLFARLRGAYLDLCERQVSKLQHQIAVEKATNDDDDLRNMEADLAALAAKIEAKRAALK